MENAKAVEFRDGLGLPAPEGPHMLCRCRYCGWRWYERPKDWVEPTPPRSCGTPESDAEAEVEAMLRPDDPFGYEMMP